MMPWWMFLVGACAVPLMMGVVLVVAVKMWRRGVAQGKAEAVEMLDTSIGLLEKRIQEAAASKAAGAPSEFQRKTAEEVCEWAESVVRLWKALRQQPR